MRMTGHHDHEKPVWYAMELCPQQFLCQAVYVAHDRIPAPDAATWPSAHHDGCSWYRLWICIYYSMSENVPCLKLKSSKPYTEFVKLSWLTSAKTFVFTKPDETGVSVLPGFQVRDLTWCISEVQPSNTSFISNCLLLYFSWLSPDFLSLSLGNVVNQA